MRQALALQPDVLFFDIRMPGQTGLDAAVELAERWPTEGTQERPFPALVFVTAYDEYAVQAFEAQAVDYLLKPVQPQRLQKTVEKLALALAKPTQHAINFEATLGQLRGLLAGPATAPKPPLQVIQASVGSTIRMVPVDEVLCFEAADKYVRVLTAARELQHYSGDRSRYQQRIEQEVSGMTEPIQPDTELRRRSGRRRGGSPRGRSATGPRPRRW